MKLITAIVGREDAVAVEHGLTSEGFSVTRLATTGGFLHAGNVTFLIAVNDESVDAAIDIIAKHSSERTQYMPSTTSFGTGITEAYPIEVTAGGVTLFVQNIERFEKL